MLLTRTTAQRDSQLLQVTLMLYGTHAHPKRNVAPPWIIHALHTPRPDHGLLAQNVQAPTPVVFPCTHHDRRLVLVHVKGSTQHRLHQTMRVGDRRNVHDIDDSSRRRSPLRARCLGRVTPLSPGAHQIEGKRCRHPQWTGATWRRLRVANSDARSFESKPFDGSRASGGGGRFNFFNASSAAKPPVPPPASFPDHSSVSSAVAMCNSCNNSTRMNVSVKGQKASTINMHGARDSTLPPRRLYLPQAPGPSYGSPQGHRTHAARPPKDAN